MAVFLILFTTFTAAAALVCDYELSVELTNRKYNGIEYEEGDYFVDNTTGVERGCVCMKERCMRKCCPLGQGFNKITRQCADLQEAFVPSIWEGSEVKPGFNATKEFHIIANFLNCSAKDNEYTLIVHDSTLKHHLQTDGKYYSMIEEDEYTARDPDKYCIDNFFIENNETKTTKIELQGLICFKPKEENNTNITTSICMLISCFFMILTIAVYSLLPELRTLHGLVLITYLLCFFVAFLCMAIMQLELTWRYISIAACTSLTFVIYFTILAAFFWLNVMCYNLWSKLRLQENAPHKLKMRRFLSYCAYAFGIPIVLTVIMAVLEFSNLPRHKLLPNLDQGCFLYGFSKLLYLYMPMMLICAANLVIFILTAKRISDIKKHTQQLKLKDTQRFTLYIELFIVTGLSWIFEVISFFYPHIDYLWQFIDAYNSLVGLLIFIIFVCKKKVLILIKQRYKQLMGAPVPRKQSTSTSSRSVSLSREDIQMNSNTLLEYADENDGRR